jgi:hypothetical protein
MIIKLSLINDFKFHGDSLLMLNLLLGDSTVYKVHWLLTFPRTILPLIIRAEVSSVSTQKQVQHQS